MIRFACLVRSLCSAVVALLGGVLPRSQSQNSEYAIRVQALFSVFTINLAKKICPFAKVLNGQKKSPSEEGQQENIYGGG